MRCTAVALVALAMFRDAAAGTHCHERSQVLGRRHCDGFGGRWATRVGQAFAFGLMDSTFQLDHFEQPERGFAELTTGPAGTAEAHATFVGTRDTTLYGYRTGASFRGDWLTLAVEFGLEAGSAPRMLATSGDSAVASDPTAFAILSGATAGVRYRIGRVEAGVELHAGIRDLHSYVELPAAYTTCVPRGCNTLDATTLQGLVVPRARVDFWLARRLTIGLSYGHAIVGDGDIVALTIYTHIQPFDGF